MIGLIRRIHLGRRALDRIRHEKRRADEFHRRAVAAEIGLREMQRGLEDLVRQRDSLQSQLATSRKARSAQADLIREYEVTILQLRLGAAADRVGAERRIHARDLQLAELGA